MNNHQIIRRSEMLAAKLELGGSPIELAPYAATGLLAVAIGPRGNGKTNAGLVIAEQLSAQGWVSVLIDPEGELASLYGDAVADAADLRRKLTRRSRPILVVAARDAGEFIDYGRAILDVADRHRKPTFVMIDEGQLFSASRKRSRDIGEAADIVNEFAARGRKRALDFFITALRYSGSLHRCVFGNMNLTLVGCQQDATSWSALAPQFRASRIDFGDLHALGPGEFFCFSRSGVEKVRMPMAAALAKVALKAPHARRNLPANFVEWDRAMRQLPTQDLAALSDPVVSLLGAVAGLSPQQMLAGANALNDELEARQ
jgi:hypothetical protein